MLLFILVYQAVDVSDLQLFDSQPNIKISQLDILCVQICICNLGLFYCDINDVFPAGH